MVPSKINDTPAPTKTEPSEEAKGFEGELPTTLVASRQSEIDPINERINSEDEEEERVVGSDVPEQIILQETKGFIVCDMQSDPVTSEDEYRMSL